MTPNCTHVITSESLLRDAGDAVATVAAEYADARPNSAKAREAREAVKVNLKHAEILELRGIRQALEQIALAR